MAKHALLTGLLCAVLCTIICPSARGGSINFTTSIQYKDDWQSPFNSGPILGDVSALPMDYDGHETVAAWGIEVPYSGYADTMSEYDYKQSKIGKTNVVNVGALASSAFVEGDDNITAKASVDFSMTIGEVQPPPVSSTSPPIIPFSMTPWVHVNCETEAWGGNTTGTSSCKASAGASIADMSNPWMQNGSDFVKVTLSAMGTDSNGYTPLNIDAFAGDTLGITLGTDLKVGGGVMACKNSPSAPWYYCRSLDANASAEVDPLFEFDQQAFNQEMGANTYNLSDYYDFTFSPNIPAPTPIPEASSLLLFGTNLLIFAPLLRRRSGRT